MERELPLITIEGTDFLVDVNKLELREKANPKNIIAYEDMEEVDDGYSFRYSRLEKNVSINVNLEVVTIKIPEFVKLDPEGMAAKYNIDDVNGKTDFEVMVDQEAYDLRVKKGMLPTVEIAGHTFYVDMRMDKLRPKDEFLSKGIVFSDIESYYDRDKREYTIPYNPKTYEFQEPDYVNIKEFPKDLIAVSFPHERLLDRIGWNRKYFDDLKSGLLKCGLNLRFTAKRVPWKKTFLAGVIQINIRPDDTPKKIEEKKQTHPKQIKLKGRRM
ncbi:hypothetical protein [Pedobacter alluvionis]|uniref:Uncharacterized protein n=1 Tax=Pedobacter alluvionis TaxID=475253 RepID=A0A497XY36_9SPHI|nr:hypothetical protein [Pedobacter alluvionis]RLJ75102.1 hypothetical protein BCL90_3449 [Pedobacter alluvionis]TFB30207.1 hypothetical protein E3V97_18740 [Pedobacter alluvionis]